MVKDFRFFAESMSVETDSIANPSIARLKIPLIHVGANKKHLRWTPETLKEIAPMFKDVVFKYDVGGHEGSSHVPNKMSSPYTDVGWVDKSYYSKDNGGTLYVEGDITHPEVIEKLIRTTSNGKRELNYASMGAAIDPTLATCSICDQPYSDCNHERGETYGGQVCEIVPTPESVNKALHAALTNDPADPSAEIMNVVFAENKFLRGEKMTEEEEKKKKEETIPETAALPKPSGGMEVSAKDVKFKRGVETAQEEDVKLPANLPDAEKTEMAKAKMETAQDEETDEEKKKKEDAGVVETAQEMPAEAGEQALQERVAALEQMVFALKEKIDVDVTEPATPEPTAEEILPMTQDNVDGDNEEPPVGKSTENSGPSGGPESTAPVGEGKKTPDETEYSDMRIKYTNRLMIELADNGVKLGKFKNEDKAKEFFKGKTVKELEVFCDAFDGIMPKGGEKPVRQIPQYAIANKNANIEFADMTPDQRSKEYGKYGAFDEIFKRGNM